MNQVSLQAAEKSDSLVHRRPLQTSYIADAGILQ